MRQLRKAGLRDRRRVKNFNKIKYLIDDSQQSHSE